MKQHYILYQAYGNEGILLECRFSLMQLLQYNDANLFCIVLYTDNHDFFKPILQWFPYHEIVALTPGKITDWRGSHDFVHRVKINLLLDFFTNHSGSILYFDTDTYCNSSIQPLFDAIDTGTIFMHKCEGKLGSEKNSIFEKWKRFLMNNNISYKSCRIANIDAIEMWNAGVLGFSKGDLAMLQDVLHLTDIIYPLFPKHTVEQFAFSYIFQQTGRLKPADDNIYHYWDLKEYKELLQFFFNNNSHLSLTEQATRLQDLMPEKIFEDKMRYKKKCFFKKWISAKWSVDSYKKRLI